MLSWQEPNITDRNFEWFWVLDHAQLALEGVYEWNPFNFNKSNRWKKLAELAKLAEAAALALEHFRKGKIAHEIMPRQQTRIPHLRKEVNGNSKHIQR
jgi:hypothetical protein